MRQVGLCVYFYFVGPQIQTEICLRLVIQTVRYFSTIAGCFHEAAPTIAKQAHKKSVITLFPGLLPVVTLRSMLPNISDVII